MLNFNLDFLISFVEGLNSFGKTIVFLINWAVLWLPLVLPILWLTNRQKTAPNPNIHKLTLIISLYCVAPFLIWMTIVREKISLTKIGIFWQDSLLHFILFGYALSILSLVIIYIIQWSLKWLHWQNKPAINFNFMVTLVSLLLVSFIIGLIEELVFRGVFVYFFNTDYSLLITAIISSVIFALLHLIWEQENTIPQLPGLFVMGMVLFYSYTITNYNLGLAIGLHSGWVLILACMDTFDLYSYNPDFSGWLIGKKGQPLGSVMGLMVLLLTTIFLWLSSHFALI